MREIKFRVWRSGIKHMICPNSLNNAGIMLCGVSGFIQGDVIIPEFDFVLMQYTGLKDKNGKEIYEGDIVKFIMDDVIFVRAIKWFDDKGKFDFNSYVLESDCYNTFYSIVDLKDKIEIIGNIYENPEILKC